MFSKSFSVTSVSQWQDFLSIQANSALLQNDTITTITSVPAFNHSSTI
jgi:hypothetical protein